MMTRVSNGKDKFIREMGRRNITLEGECGISRAKTAEPIELPFGMVRNHVLIGITWLIRLNGVRGGYEWVCHQGWRCGLFPNYIGQSCFIINN